MHPRSPEARSVFGTGALLLCQPSEAKVTSVECRVTRNRSILCILMGRVSLVTRHVSLESGCQGWTRTNTVRFNKPSCYFDTTWHCKGLEVAGCRLQVVRRREHSLANLQLVTLQLITVKLALPAGLAPASVRLEDERLVYFGHGSPQKWIDGVVDLWIYGKHRLRHPDCPTIQQSINPTIHLEMVSAAGLAPAVTRSQAEHVAATPRAVAPANGWRRGLGSCGDGDRVPWNTYSIGDLADSKGLAPSAFPQTTGCSSN